VVLNFPTRNPLLLCRSTFAGVLRKEIDSIGCALSPLEDRLDEFSKKGQCLMRSKKVSELSLLGLLAYPTVE
jgi:hypothetical protein